MQKVITRSYEGFNTSSDRCPSKKGKVDGHVCVEEAPGVAVRR